ncbi:hypothetical protein PABG_12577 [Paracoccidioides brasiliensis Pb03]|nr:hypothetical protein PABG_12577 [Paracoccidioides brasiliensis Pb03]
MQTSDSMHVKKPWTEHSSLVQMHYQQKGTLQCMLHSYFDDCHCKSIYLLIHEDNQQRYSECHAYSPEKMLLLQKQKKHYPPPFQTMCESYMKYQKSRVGKKGKQEKLEKKQE